MPSLMQTKREAGSTTAKAFEPVADNFREGWSCQGRILAAAIQRIREGKLSKEAGHSERRRPLLNNLQACLTAGLA